MKYNIPSLALLDLCFTGSHIYLSENKFIANFMVPQNWNTSKISILQQLFQLKKEKFEAVIIKRDEPLKNQSIKMDRELNEMLSNMKISYNGKDNGKQVSEGQVVFSKKIHP